MTFNDASNHTANQRSIGGLIVETRFYHPVKNETNDQVENSFLTTSKTPRNFETGGRKWGKGRSTEKFGLYEFTSFTGKYLTSLDRQVGEGNSIIQKYHQLWETFF